MGDTAVTLTDYGLTLECTVLVLLLWSRGTRPMALRNWFRVFFAATGVAAFLGGTVHGFLPDEQSPAGALLWRATLLTIGVVAAAAWQVAARIALPERPAHWISVAVLVQFALYAALVIFVTQTFAIAIVNYLPAMLFLLGAIAVAYGRTRARPLLGGIGGIALSVVASAIQQARIGLHPVYFNHNALYHLIQAAALILIFRAAQTACDQAASPRVAMRAGFSRSGPLSQAP